MDDAKRGRLHIFLGAAPAVGKTYASLQEARRLAGAGTDVVIGLVETHGRQALAEQLEGLVLLPARQVSYRGRQFDELDLPTLLELQPRVVLVDELAHSNSPGLAHAKRWQDVEQLLDSGIDVISNLNVQHLASLSDEVERITGVAQAETVPDELVSGADQIDVVRVRSSELRDRVRSGGVFDERSTGTALTGFFGSERLDALDSLMLSWLAERGRGQPADTAAGAAGSHETGSRPPGRLVVLLSGGVEADRVLRRAAQLAASTRSELVGLRVRGPSDPRSSEPAWLEGRRRLLTELGGRYGEVGGDDEARALLHFAETEQAGHIVLSAVRRPWWQQLARGSVVRSLVRAAPLIEVHIVPVASQARRQGGEPSEVVPARRAAAWPRHLPQWRRSALPTRRRVVGYVLSVVAPALVALALVPFRQSIGLPATLLSLLLAVIVVAGAGGLGAAAVATVAGVLLADYYLTQPFHSFRLDRTSEIAALVAFALVSAVVSLLVNVLTNAGIVGARRLAVADGLARLAADCLVTAGTPVAQKTVDSLRRTLALDGVGVLRARGQDWVVEAASGEGVPRRPEEAASFVEIAQGVVLALGGSRAVAEEADLVRAFVSEIRLEQERIQLERIRSCAVRGTDP
jgi:two-component system sensor histidine kinase KdpD